MLVGRVALVSTLILLSTISVVAVGATPRHVPRETHSLARHAPGGHPTVRHARRRAPLAGSPRYASPYGRRESATPNCYYPDGTPFDPDIIGGPNHVGDGGPAVNLGGFDPCGS